MPKHGGSNKKQHDWNELLKVMQTPTRNDSKCHIIASSYDSLSNHNYDNRHHNSHDNRNKHPKGWHGEKKRDEAACATKFKRIFSNCCADSNLGKRVNDLECKVKRLENIYCKKVKKQLDELQGKKSGTGKKKPSASSSNESVASKKSHGSDQRKTAGSDRKRSNSSDRRKTSGSDRKRSNSSDRKKSSNSSRKNSIDSDQDQRRTSASVNRVVFKKESSRNSEGGFSDDSGTQSRKENYFFITTPPNYFDKDQIPVRDITGSMPVKKTVLVPKSGIGLEEIQKKNQWLESMHLCNTGPDLTYTYKCLDNEELKKPSRSLKNSFGRVEEYIGYKELEKLSGSINNSFVEYTSILKQRKDINSVAANIATFNNASKGTTRQSNVVTPSVAQPIKESFCNETNENDIKEDIENDTKTKSLSEKDIDAAVAVEKIHRSVSTCKLPIDINLYLFPKLNSNIEKQRGTLSNVKIYNSSNSRLGVRRAVCFDTPISSSSSKVSLKFASVFHRRASSK